jgi:Ca2+-binding RTX toxin-like protein
MSGTLNKAQTEFNFFAQVNGLDLGGQTPSTTDNVTAAHFHRAVAGVPGGIVFGFIGAPNNELQGETVVNAAAGTVSGSWDANEGNGTTLTAQVPNLLNNELYINFHTTVNPGGEIRGQLIRQDSGLDRVDVSSLGISDFQTLQLITTEVNGSATISATWNGQLSQMVLQGVPLARLSAADFIFASPAATTTSVGTQGADDLFGGAGADSIDGEAGNDRIFAGAGADTVEGRDGNDTVLGMGGDDQLSGGPGDDDVNGNAGNDVVNGDAGADTVRGGQGNDTVYGGAGDDPHVNGNRGDDLVYGGDGNDTVFGGQGNDTVYGDNGNDWVSGDLGNDVLYGGAGADRFLFRLGSGNDWAADFNFAQGDRIQLPTGTTYTLTSYQGQAMVTLSSGESLGLVGVAPSSFTSAWVVFV